MTSAWEYQHFLVSEAAEREAEGWEICGASLIIGGWPTVLMRRRVNR